MARSLSMKIAIAAMALAGAALAGPNVQSDYTQFVTHFPDLATPLDAGDIRHAAEAAMIDTLTTGNPGIKDLIEKTRKDQLKVVHDSELLQRLNSVEVGPNQYPQVQKIAQDAADALGLHKDFAVFITSNPEMQPSFFGFPQHGHVGNSFGRYLIVLTSGMVKALSETELKFIIGREMGHVKANHRFYSALAFAYQREKSMIPRLLPEDKPTPGAGLGGLLTFFFGKTPLPSRISEYTADRAGLVAVRDPKVGLAALAKIARGDLEGTPGFDLDQYLAQVEQATHDLTPAQVAELVGGDGYYPYILNRVGEANRFGQSEQYRALVDRATVNPFLMEAETLHAIGGSLVHWTKRLADFKDDPHTATMDPLAREVALKDLNEKVARRQKAIDELEALALSHVESLGLASENVFFKDLIGTAKRRNDARPFKGLLGKLSDQINFALSQPGLPPADADALKAKKAAIDAIKDLAPKDKPRPEGAPVAWVEGSDLPQLVATSLASLADASGGGTDEFFDRLDALRPRLQAAVVKLVVELPKDRRDALAELLSNAGGQMARLTAELQSAGTDAPALEALFDKHFDEATQVLKTMPMFLIRRALSSYANLSI